MARYIDADELEELFREVIGGIAKRPEIMNGNLEHMIRASAMVIEMIRDAPTADVRENVHGKWIEKAGQDWKYSKEYNCSVCGKYRLVTNPAGWEWNFCPHCGADMDERRE